LVSGVVLFSCGNPTTSPQSITYVGFGTDSLYKLSITETGNRAAYVGNSGDFYKLEIISFNGTVNTSTGIIQSIEANIWKLKPNSATVSFEIEINTDTQEMAKISGTIKCDDESESPQIVYDTPITLRQLASSPQGSINVASLFDGKISETDTTGIDFQGGQVIVYKLTVSYNEALQLMLSTYGLFRGPCLNQTHIYDGNVRIEDCINLNGVRILDSSSQPSYGFEWAKNAN
jgi:hypothetical protein